MHRLTGIELTFIVNAYDNGASGVFHIAVRSKVDPSIGKLEFCTEQNVLETQNVLIAATNANVRMFEY